MKLNKSKVKNGVWYRDSLWKVINIVQPNKYQDFLVLEIERNEGWDDGVVAVDLAVIDVFNDVFYPNTPAVRRIMERRRKEDDRRSKEEHSLGSSILEKESMSMFCDNDEVDL